MRISIILSGYPVFSETFIAREILGLERCGYDLQISALGYWPLCSRNTIHDAIAAKAVHLSLLNPANWLRLVQAWRALRHNRRWQDVKVLLEEDRRLIGGFSALMALVKAMLWWKLNQVSPPAVIYAHWINRPASVARYAACLAGLPWCCSAHARDVWRANPDTLRNRLASADQVVTCNSQAYGILHRFAADPAKLHLSHHGIDFSLFPAPGAAQPGSNRFATKGTVIILSVGRAVPKKGFDILLRALAKLPSDIDWRMEHAGGGVGQLRLKLLAFWLGVAERVTWLGPLPSKVLLERYRQADIFVLASLVDRGGDQDGLPNVIVEASSQALPCVSTRLPSIEDLIVDGSNGLLVAPGDASGLAVAIEKLAKDPALRRKLGSAAEHRVRERFNCETSIKQVCRLLEASVCRGAHQ